MKNQNKDIAFDTYFAAANGFCGFRSYFKKILSKKDLDSLYIIKGGPGTGKSSLMKKIRSYFVRKGCAVDSIYCSSDPDSLDGIIIQKDGKRAALIDGTAPHSEDPEFPGAVDEILNLGDMWDSGILKENRNEILEISDRKAFAYKTAYSFLSCAEGPFNIMLDIAQKTFDKDKAKDICLNIINDFPKLKHGRHEEVRLISSFGKNGLYKINDNNLKSTRCISLVGDEICRYVFSETLLEEYRNVFGDLIRFPSPLSDKITEAIYIKDHDIFISANSGFDEKILIEDCFSVRDETEEVIFGDARMLYGFSTESAKKYFEIASTEHFKLEDIYRSAMNFEVVNKVGRELTEKISKILSV